MAAQWQTVAEYDQEQISEARFTLVYLLAEEGDEPTHIYRLVGEWL